MENTTTKTTSVWAFIFLATAVMLIGGLAVVPALIVEEAEAKCDNGVKENGKECKPKKVKA
jgi:hypothetical protein